MIEFKRVFVDTAPIIYYLENVSIRILKLWMLCRLLRLLPVDVICFSRMINN